jgi:hypothetical protein
MTVPGIGLEGPSIHYCILIVIVTPPVDVEAPVEPLPDPVVDPVLEPPPELAAAAVTAIVACWVLELPVAIITGTTPLTPFGTVTLIATAPELVEADAGVV